MTVFDDDEGAVFLEPIKTGGLKIVLANDSELAQEYIVEAKKFLGAVKSQHAVNAHTRNSFNSPYIFQSKTLPDGTVIKVTSEPALDTIRIEPIQDVDEDVKPPEFEPEDYKFKVDADFEVPYLWVGIRYIDGGVTISSDYTGRASRSHLCVWEPLKDDLSQFNIVSNRDYLLSESDSAEPQSVYPLGPNKSDNLTVEINYTDRNGVTWDAIIWAENPRIGKYFAKAMMEGPDCYRASPTNVEIKVIVGKNTDKAIGIEAVGGIERFKEIVSIKEMTYYKRGILPMGWFKYKERSTFIDCPECLGPVADYGTNPHGDHWWQDCVAITVSKGLTKFSIEINGLGASYEDIDGNSSALKSSQIPVPGFVSGKFPDKKDVCAVCETDTLWSTGVYVVVNSDYEYYPDTPPIICLSNGSRYDVELYLAVKLSMYSKYKVGIGESAFSQAQIPTTMDITGDVYGQVRHIELIPGPFGTGGGSEPVEVSNFTVLMATEVVCFGVGAGGYSGFTPDGDLYSSDREAFFAVHGPMIIGGEAYWGGFFVTQSFRANADHTDYEYVWHSYRPASLSDPMAVSWGGTTSYLIECRQSWIVK